MRGGTRPTTCGSEVTSLKVSDLDGAQYPSCHLHFSRRPFDAGVSLLGILFVWIYETELAANNSSPAGSIPRTCIEPELYGQTGSVSLFSIFAMNSTKQLICMAQ